MDAGRGEKVSWHCPAPLEKTLQINDLDPFPNEFQSLGRPSCPMAAYGWIAHQAAAAGGPFALSDSERTVGILEAAGFVDITCTAFEAMIDVAVGSSLDETAAFLSQMGPAGALLPPAGCR